MLEALQEQPPPIHADNQLQDMSLGSFGLQSIEKIMAWMAPPNMMGCMDLSNQSKGYHMGLYFLL